MELLHLLSTDIGGVVFSYLNKYEDNRFVLRQLSRSFYRLPLYETLSINKQPKTFLSGFLRTNRVRNLVIRNHNKNLFKIPRDLFRYVRKIVIHTLDSKELHLLCRLFSRYHITNLKVMYCTCPLPLSLLSFSSLERLDITITSRENQDPVLHLLRINRSTLKKLKLGIYTGKGVEEDIVTTIIKQDLCLEHIDIRGNLFSYEMIRSCTRHIIPIIPYIESKSDMLQYIVRLRLDGLANRHLPTIFRNLAVVGDLCLYGGLSNYEHVTYVDGHEFKYVLRDYDNHDLSLPYDGTVADILDIKSRALTVLFMNGFTIRRFCVPSLTEMVIEDVCFTMPVRLPMLRYLYVENAVMDPRRFTLDVFDFPGLMSLELIHCIVKDMFVYHSLRTVNIQHSILSIDMEDLIERHKRCLGSVLFYMNRWTDTQKKKGCSDIMRSNKIKIHHHCIEEW